jgi:hypothetical protein
MMTISTLIGVPMTFIGASPKRVVYKMMKKDFIATCKHDYMLEVKERLDVAYQIQIEIETGNHRKFLDELVRVGMIKIVE